MIVVDGYIQKHSYRSFAWMVLLSTLAPMLRYVGLAFVVTGLLIILIENRKSFPVLFRDGFVLGLISIAPIFWWLIIHNVMTYGSLWGTSNNQVVDVAQNTELALTKMLHWFIPYFSVLMPLLTQPFILFGIVTLFIILINRRNKENWLAWAKNFTVPATYPIIVYTLVYFPALALTIITADHRDLFSDRNYELCFHYV